MISFTDDTLFAVGTPDSIYLSLRNIHVLKAVWVLYIDRISRRSSLSVSCLNVAADKHWENWCRYMVSALSSWELFSIIFISPSVILDRSVLGKPLWFSAGDGLSRRGFTELKERDIYGWVWVDCSSVGDGWFIYHFLIYLWNRSAESDNQPLQSR